jgi:hypothetical protein
MNRTIAGLLVLVLLSVGARTPESETKSLEWFKALVDADLIKIPSDAIVAATVEVSGNWYAMEGKEIACLTKLLARGSPVPAPPPEMSVIPISLHNRIVLWGFDGRNLVAVDVVLVDSKVSALKSFRTLKRYLVAEDAERDPLVRMFDRIDKGKAVPLAVKQGAQMPLPAKEKAASRKEMPSQKQTADDASDKKKQSGLPPISQTNSSNRPCGPTASLP